MGVFLWLFLSSIFAFSLSPGFYNGQNLQYASWDEVAKEIQSGDILVLGETHYQWPVSDFQVHILESLRSLGNKVHVGMEFLDFTKQPLVDALQDGVLSEKDFEKQAWEGGDFEFYRRQILFPQKGLGERLVALNAPRALTRFVARHGLEKLPDSLRSLLPPNFELGNEKYFERFRKAMSHGIGEEGLRRYFAAQSIWDDTMAYRASEFLNSVSDGVFVIIVGEFHVAYGGGLPDRLQKRIPHRRIWTMSQLPDNLVMEDYGPSMDYGQRAGWIYVFNLSDPKKQLRKREKGPN
ncbi:MAG: ChaN family lipoprotein [Pseudobdellovibrionaceae bacterium]|nr:ChaN family lipoprotein [Pseudobdellovibrionaceae bacterium]